MKREMLKVKLQSIAEHGSVNIGHVRQPRYVPKELSKKKVNNIYEESGCKEKDQEFILGFPSVSSGKKIHLPMQKTQVQSVVW